LQAQNHSKGGACFTLMLPAGLEDVADVAGPLLSSTQAPEEQSP